MIQTRGKIDLLYPTVGLRKCGEPSGLQIERLEGLWVVPEEVVDMRFRFYSGLHVREITTRSLFPNGDSY